MTTVLIEKYVSIFRRVSDTVMGPAHAQLAQKVNLYLNRSHPCRPFATRHRSILKTTGKTALVCVCLFVCELDTITRHKQSTCFSHLPVGYTYYNRSLDIRNPNITFPITILLPLKQIDRHHDVNNREALLRL